MVSCLLIFINWNFLKRSLLIGYVQIKSLFRTDTNQVVLLLGLNLSFYLFARSPIIFCLEFIVLWLIISFCLLKNTSNWKLFNPESWLFGLNKTICGSDLQCSSTYIYIDLSLNLSLLISYMSQSLMLKCSNWSHSSRLFHCCVS